MANKTNQKKLRLGYSLHINENGVWRRVGDGIGLFASSYDANLYREKKHPKVVKWQIQGVKVSPLPSIKQHYQPAREEKEVGSINENK